MPTIAEALALALQHRQAGRLQAAEQIYRQILRVDPNQADALHLLGTLAHQVGQCQAAVDLIARAVSLNGSSAEYHGSLAKAYHASGRIPEAIGCYRRAVTLQPDLSEAHNNLGIALRSQGNLDEAVAAFRRAAATDPASAGAHNNLGNGLREQGRLEDAIASFRRALALQPQLAEVHNNLAVVFLKQRDPEQALFSCRRALQLKPDFAEAHNNIGNAFMELARLDDAIASFRRALELNPRFVDAHSNLGNAFRERGELEDAIASYRRALTLDPLLARAHNNLGVAFKDQRKLEESIACFHRALDLEPDFVEARHNLGAAYASQGDLDAAVECFSRVLERDPKFAEAYNSLGNACKDQGKLAEAIGCYRQAVELRPEDLAAWDNLLYTQIFSPDFDSATLCAERRQWNQRCAAPLASLIQPHANDPSPDRRLRIGYVSADFYQHAESFFVLPLLQSHDRERFEIHAYAGVRAPDQVTAHFRRSVDLWHDVRALGNAELAAKVRGDGIDLLIDLSMHMDGNRLPLFARKPAPIQVTWLAYPASTGLTAIDYRLTDPMLDPGEADDPLSSEELVRLPRSWVCYQPWRHAPEPSPLPASRNGVITFGSLNNFCKINARVLDLWARALAAVNDSRLLLLAKRGSHRSATRSFFQERGIRGDRIDFLDPAPAEIYLSYYHQIDIALDPFPYNGVTTSCDALWMGAPVVTLVGPMAPARTGLSLLSNLGLPEYAAHSEPDYVRICADLAANLPKLADLRQTLRPRMLGSPLMDARGFARYVEAAYRQMWRRWCAH